MAIDFKEKTIKYVNKDYQSLKRDLMDFAQAHHSGNFQDFNESSPGMALLEMAAFVGDILSFYQDQAFDEVRATTARQIENVTEFAKKLGYRPSGKRAARGETTIFIEVPATTVNGTRVPDPSYMPIFKVGSKLQGPGTVFETVSDVFFSASAPTENTTSYRQVTGSQFDSTTGLPTHFAVAKNVEAIAGETKTDTVFVDSFQAFREIELAEEDVIEVIGVTDSDGNEWFEVDYLAQETIFTSDTNDSDDNSVVPYVMKLRAVPRRFITDRDPLTKKTSLIFGSGDGVNFDDELIPNIADLALPIAGRQAFSSFAIDPQNFLKTRTLGLSPFNTTLTITYRVGGGEQTNVPPGSIKSVNEALLEFTSTNLDPIKKSDVVNSVECLNVKKTEGGGPEESISEIKANSAAFFAAQQRVVTREDYVARIFSMPPKFGRVDKAFVRKESGSSGINVHILSRDENGHFAQATSTLVGNIKRYLSKYRMLTDGVNLLQTDIINLRVDFGVVIAPKLNRNEVLAKCLSILRDELHNDNMQVGQPIVLSDLSAKLQDVVGVISVYDLRFKNVFGTVNGLNYADNAQKSVRLDVQAWTQNGILYCPGNGIFQVKYPTKDINGASK